MPTIKAGNTITLKSNRIPLYSQIPDWCDDRVIPIFPTEQTFEVLEIKGTKIILQAIAHEEDRPFEWFKNAIAKVIEEEPQTVDTIREPQRINIGSQGISVEYTEPPVETPPVPQYSPLQYPTIQAEYKSAIATHKGVQYWIAGSHAKGNKPAEYHYFIDHNGNVTKSELSYGSTVFAGRWAREAIDKFAVLQEV